MQKKEGEISKLAWRQQLSESEKKELLERESHPNSAEISIYINNYNDIFSSFDPRPYSQKAISDDFLLETKKATLVKATEAIDLKIIMPVKERNTSEENVIKKRLREFFKKHEAISDREVHKTIGQGIIFMVMGVILMFFATLILFKYHQTLFIMNFLVILLEPGGWFFFWEGLGLIVFESKKKKPEVAFFRKVANAKITFDSA